MAVQLPSNPDVIAERLASLEDPALAERLFLDHPGLYADEPPQTERQVLAWATRRFGTIALAVTGAVSIVAGYLLAPLVAGKHEAAVPITAPPRAVVAVPLAAPPHRAPPAHHVAVRRPAAHPQHHPAAVPVTHPASPIHHAAVVAHPAPNREAERLRARIAAQEAQLRALQQRVALEEAAARAAHARAAAAARSAPAPARAPVASTEAATETAPQTATRTTTATATAPVDVPAPATDAGAKPPPASPHGGWTEHIPVQYGPIGHVLLGGPIDPCTPPGGRVGIVVNAILSHSGAGIRF